MVRDRKGTRLITLQPPAPLPEKLHRALVELWRFRDRNDYAPSLREMADACDSGSTSTLSRRYGQLADLGFVKSNNWEARTLRLTAQGRLYVLMHESEQQRKQRVAEYVY